MRQPLSSRGLVVAALLIAIGVVAFAYEGLLFAARRGDVGAGGFPTLPVLGALTLVGGLSVGFVATTSAYRSPPLP